MKERLCHYYKKVKEHWAALAVSLLIGLIFLLPHLLIPLLQDDSKNYSPLVVKGVDARSVDEVFYAAYVQEASEGHLIPRSNILEWKDTAVLSHAGAPFPSLLLGMMSLVLGGVVNTYIFSYFFFTAISSLLMYVISYSLTKNKILSLVAPPLLFFSPTYLLKFFSDQIVQPISYFSRFYPVLVDFPIFAVTLLAVLWLLREKKWKAALLSGILGGLLFYTYFYYWTFYITFMGLLLAMVIFRKNFVLSKKIMVSGLVTIVIGVTFFLNSINTIANQAEILRRLNATFTRTPDWPITLFLLSIVIMLVYAALYTANKRSEDRTNKEKNETHFYFLLILVLAGIVTMNVQVIMGYTINPRHWLTTSIWPILVLVGIYLLHFIEETNLERENLKKIIKKSSFIFICLLISFGLIWQVTFSYNTYPAYTLSTPQVELFGWLNDNTTKDEVVLSLSSEMILLVPVYTHNNNFVPNAVVEPIPISEIITRRLIAYKIIGIPEEKIIFLDKPCAFSELMSFERAKEGEYNYSLFEEGFSHLLTFEGSFSSKGCTIPTPFKEGVQKTYAALPEEWGQLTQRYVVDYVILGPYEKSISSHREIEKHAGIVYRNAEFTVYKIDK